MRNLLIYCYLLVSSLANVIQLTTKNFDSVVSNPDGNPTLVKFYATWCGHCKTLAPIYEEIAQHYSESDVQIAEIDCESNRPICSQFKIKGFPTMKLFLGNNDSDDAENVVDFKSSRSKANLIEFIDSNLEVSIPVVESSPSKIVQISELDFDEIKSQDKDLYVVFTANWCQHCLKLHPDWEDLAKVFENDSNIIIGEVETTSVPHKSLLSRYNIKSFPTILGFLQNGDILEYNFKERDLSTLVKWVNSNSGLFRDIDGGISSEAGLIPEIDKLLGEIQAYQDDHGLLHDLVNKVEKIEGSEYYKKLINKIINGEHQTYIPGEIDRLNKILKNKLNQSQLDNIHKRLNVLKKFSSIIF
ncbi:hypothetical protein WICMUC_005101 [Wickerhamomyces mucosus]|uniref:protein disulfide-isomerase n=1 Tax=Wickerhamomyces mucosus TaxID=1378264 RepID=A0A9P8PB58_9ASCO|nr:hypothetical protein WICMUC_005101 [Wickerhamomyces mucosus]